MPLGSAPAVLWHAQNNTDGSVTLKPMTEPVPVQPTMIPGQVYIQTLPGHSKPAFVRQRKPHVSSLFGLTALAEALGPLSLFSTKKTVKKVRRSSVPTPRQKRGYPAPLPLHPQSAAVSSRVVVTPGPATCHAAVQTSSSIVALATSSSTPSSQATSSPSTCPAVTQASTSSTPSPSVRQASLSSTSSPVLRQASSFSTPSSTAPQASSSTSSPTVAQASPTSASSPTVVQVFPSGKTAGISSAGTLRSICAACGNFRSPHYQRRHALTPGVMPKTSICKKCVDKETSSEESDGAFERSRKMKNRRRRRQRSSETTEDKDSRSSSRSYRSTTRDKYKSFAMEGSSSECHQPTKVERAPRPSSRPVRVVRVSHDEPRAQVSQAADQPRAGSLSFRHVRVSQAAGERYSRDSAAAGAPESRGPSLVRRARSPPIFQERAFRQAAEPHRSHRKRDRGEMEDETDRNYGSVSLSSPSSPVYYGRFRAVGDRHLSRVVRPYYAVADTANGADHGPSYLPTPPGSYESDRPRSISSAHQASPSHDGPQGAADESQWGHLPGYVPRSQRTSDPWDEVMFGDDNHDSMSFGWWEEGV